MRNSDFIACDELEKWKYQLPAQPIYRFGGDSPGESHGFDFQLLVARLYRGEFPIHHRLNSSYPLCQC